MTRALSLTCLVLLALAGSAFAKPKIAVLGLEVQDPAATQAGKEITDQLRAQARSGTGKYEIASNSDKELVDEKLMSSCDSELPGCMSPIGAQIGANRLLYGHIRKVGDNFIIDLVLLNVDNKTREKAFANQRISTVDAADPVKLGSFAKSLYKAITSESSTGTLIVEVSNKDADRGKVSIDGDEKGFLSSGRLPIQNVAEGKHTLVVEVGGFQRFSKEVTVTANDRVTIPVTLTPDGTGGGGLIERGGTVSEGTHTNYWKPMFVAGSVLAIAGGSFWAFSFVKESDAEGRITHYVGDPALMKEADESQCGRPVKDVFPEDRDENYNKAARTSQTALGDACKYRGWTKYGIAATAIGGVIMLGTFYSAWLKDNENEQNKSGQGKAGKAKKPSIAVTPVFGPNGGMATLRIDW